MQERPLIIDVDGVEIRVPSRCLSGMVTAAWPLEGTCALGKDDRGGPVTGACALSKDDRENLLLTALSYFEEHPELVSACPHARNSPHFLLLEREVSVFIIAKVMTLMYPWDWETYMYKVVRLDRADVLHVLLCAMETNACPELASIVQSMRIPLFDQEAEPTASGILAHAVRQNARKCLALLFKSPPPTDLTGITFETGIPDLSPDRMRAILGITEWDLSLQLTICHQLSYDINRLLDMLCSVAPCLALKRNVSPATPHIGRPSPFALLMAAGARDAAKKVARIALAAWPADGWSIAILEALDACNFGPGDTKILQEATDVLVSSAPEQMLAEHIRSMVSTLAEHASRSRDVYDISLMQVAQRDLRILVPYFLSAGGKQGLINFLLAARSICTPGLVSNSTASAPTTAQARASVPAQGTRSSKAKAQKAKKQKASAAPANVPSETRDASMPAKNRQDCHADDIRQGIAQADSVLLEQAALSLFWPHLKCCPPTRVRPKADKAKTCGHTVVFSPWPRDEQVYLAQSDIVLD